MSETTEKEAIERFCDDLRSGADAVLKLQRPDRHPFSSTAFLKNMSGAAGSANQLAIMQQNPDFYGIRDAITLLAEQVKCMAIDNFLDGEPKKFKGNNPFVEVSVMLRAIADNGLRIATSKPMARETALEAVDKKAEIMRKVIDDRE